MLGNDKIPVQIEVYGEPGVGKTHFCVNMPDPFIIDVSPTAESRINARLTACDYKHCKDMADIRGGIKTAKDGGFMSVCFDPSIYLQGIAADEWLIEENIIRKKKDKPPLTRVYPFMRYGDVRKKIDSIFADIMNHDMNLVCTSQMQDQYNGKKKTGKRIPAGYPKLDFQSHIRLRLAIKSNKRICLVRKNRFVDSLSDKYFKTIPNPTFECLVDRICSATGLDPDTFII